MARPNFFTKRVNDIERKMITALREYLQRTQRTALRLVIREAATNIRELSKVRKNITTKSRSLKQTAASHRYSEAVLLFLVSVFIQRYTLNDFIALVYWFFEPQTLFHFGAILFLNNLASVEQFYGKTVRNLRRHLSHRFINPLNHHKPNHRDHKCETF